MSTQTSSRAVDATTTDGLDGWTHSLTRAFAAAILAGVAALAFVVWPLAVGAAAVSAFAVYAVSAAVSGARVTFGTGHTRSRSRSARTARDRRSTRSNSVARGGRLR